MTRLLLIAAFGGVGSVLRYLLSMLVQRQSAGTFPWGVLAVNVLGCFTAGVLAAMFAGRWTGREDLRLALMVGLMGGFTTFSAFGVDTFELFRSNRAGLAAMNVLLSVTLGLVGVWAGWRIAE
jgi:CrcB protein